MPSCLVGSPGSVLEALGVNPGCLLRVCAGQCNVDEDCAAGLFCQVREDGENVPGCTGTPESDSYNYCINTNPNA